MNELLLNIHENVRIFLSFLVYIVILILVHLKLRLSFVVALTIGIYVTLDSKSTFCGSFSPKNVIDVRQTWTVSILTVFCARY